jgi:hypothetical protein
MPRASNAKPDQDAVFVAWQSGAAEIDGVAYSVVEGERRRGSDALVQAHPWLFIEDGATEGETLNAFTQLVDSHDAEQAAVEHEVQLAGPLPVPLAIEDVIRLSRSVAVRAGYVENQKLATYDAGTMFAAASEVASLLPDDSYEHTEIQFTKAAKGRRR